MTQEVSRCIFCGDTPQTRTHIFRRAWMKQLMVPAPGPFEMQHQTADMSGASRESAWEIDQFDMAPGAACSACNNGWMDEVDRAAEQIIQPMVIGHKATIRGYLNQKAVARWVTQISILIDQTQVRQVVRPEMARMFYADKEPAAGMVIWLARTAPAWSIEGWQRAWCITSRANPVPSNRPNLGLFTFRIVHFVVQALVPLDDVSRLTLAFTRGKENMRFLKQLWPSNYMPVSWPPSATISAETLEDFARSFEPEGGLKPGERYDY